jgi:hypothetical protein
MLARPRRDRQGAPCLGSIRGADRWQRADVPSSWEIAQARADHDRQAEDDLRRRLHNVSGLLSDVLRRRRAAGYDSGMAWRED